MDTVSAARQTYAVQRRGYDPDRREWTWSTLYIGTYRNCNTLHADLENRTLWTYRVIGVTSHAPQPTTTLTTDAFEDLVSTCEAIARLSDGQGQLNLYMVAGQARAALAKAKAQTV